jgi:hypothetical protein
MEGYHDDLLMAMAMCLWVIEHSFKNLERLENQTKAMLSSWVSSANLNSKPLTTTTVNENGQKKVVNRPNPYHQSFRNTQDPRGDFMWLFSGMK